MSHFGKPAQPFSQESFEWLKNTVEGKIVYCQLIQLDQYRRIVSLSAMFHPYINIYMFNPRPFLLYRLPCRT